MSKAKLRVNSVLPLIILKVGMLDDTSLFGTRKWALYTGDRQHFQLFSKALADIRTFASTITRGRSGLPAAST